jgi:hypothetical protein
MRRLGLPTGLVDGPVTFVIAEIFLGLSLIESGGESALND